MTDSNLFVSSCDRRELARRRAHQQWTALELVRSHPVLVTLMFAVIGAAAFVAGHGGI
ncbi:MAG: hypothetical protein J2O48_02630 [Solirubrobacterales bacterium]|nr:hypothetical protein [Solirubrobacterales bacterium]